MKKIIFLVTILYCFNVFADGGDDYGNRAYIYEYEPNINVQYISVFDTIAYKYNIEKDKTRDIFVTSNIAVYNFSKDSINYIFKNINPGTIVNLIYETEYNQQYKTILFNDQSTSAYESDSDLLIFEHSNNKNVEKRPISNNIIIISKNISYELTTIWIADKWGNNLQKFFEFDNTWNWEIDVKNQVIRCTRQVGNTIEVKNLKY